MTTTQAAAATITQVRPGIFQVATPNFIATVDAECYIPEVFVRYAAGIGKANGCDPVYSRDYDFRGTGITQTVVNANPGHTAIEGEHATVEALLDIADKYRAEQPCSCHTDR